jgi:hypothetical protein
MTIHTSVRLAWRVDAAPRSLDQHLKRFRDEVRAPVAALAARHPRLADLAISFPALAVALTHAPDPAPLTALVVAGDPLAAIAEAARVPLWLKKLPPECFFGALPPLPDSPDFVRRIANHLPQHRMNAKAWLEAVALAAYWGNEDVAVWLAREVSRLKNRVRVLDRRQIRRIALWAWFSGAPGTRGAALIEKPFRAAMNMATAQRWARQWIETVDLHLNLGDGKLADVWLTPDHIDGYDFVPLATAADLVAEAEAMDNCLRTYGSDLAHNTSRLWSMRRDGQRVATLRLTRSRSEPLPNLYEIRLPRNVVAPAELWWAAHRWLARHDLRRVPDDCFPWDSAPLDVAMWRQIWRPWWLAKRRLPKTLPLTPTRHLLAWL